MRLTPLRIREIAFPDPGTVLRKQRSESTVVACLDSAPPACVAKGYG